MLNRLVYKIFPCLFNFIYSLKLLHEIIEGRSIYNNRRKFGISSSFTALHYTQEDFMALFIQYQHYILAMKKRRLTDVSLSIKHLSRNFFALIFFQKMIHSFQCFYCVIIFLLFPIYFYSSRQLLNFVPTCYIDILSCNCSKIQN